MRLLFATPATGSGGAEIHLARLLDPPRPGDWDATLTCESEPGLGPLIDAAAALQVSCIPATIGWEDRRSHDANTARQYAAFARVIDMTRPDAAVIALPWPTYGRGLAAACVERGLPALLIFHLARPDIELEAGDRPGIQRSLAGGHALVAVSESVRDVVAGLFAIPTESIAVIENGVDLPPEQGPAARAALRRSVRQELGIGENAPLVLTVGRLDRQKGHEDLVAALGAVEAAVPGTHFVWLGEGPERVPLEAALRRQGRLGRMVSLPGQIAGIDRYYWAADIFALPTRYEGWSLALSEAAAHGCPIVTTGVCGQDRRFPDGVRALLHAAGDASGLASRIIRLLGDGEMASRLGAAARGWAREHGNQAMKEAYAALIGRLVGRG
jgi:glycosyltransferase involved in cell wall biosynthesis